MAPREERRTRMDFKSAIDAHVAWKAKLASYIAKPDRSLNPVTVGQDSQCELGRWLKGEGAKLAASPDFQQLAADHARFHQAAGEVIRKADAGQNVTEEIALGTKSEYAAASSAVVLALMRMMRKPA